MSRVLFLGAIFTMAAALPAAAQGPVVGRPQWMGPLVTTELQPPVPQKAAPNAPSFAPVAAQLRSLKWYGGSYFDDSLGRRWRRTTGLPTTPLPTGMSGWTLQMNDGKHYFYGNGGQLFALCTPPS